MLNKAVRYDFHLTNHETGQPLSEATCVLYNAETGEEEWAASASGQIFKAFATNKDGRTSVYINPGDYLLKITPPNGEAQTKTIHVKDTENIHDCPNCRRLVGEDEWSDSDYICTKCRYG